MELKTCRRCGLPLAESHKFCPRCGTQVTPPKPPKPPREGEKISTGLFWVLITLIVALTAGGIISAFIFFSDDDMEKTISSYIPDTEQTSDVAPFGADSTLYDTQRLELDRQNRQLMEYLERQESLAEDHDRYLELQKEWASDSANAYYQDLLTPQEENDR